MTSNYPEILTNPFLVIAVAVILFYILYYLCYVVQKPKFICAQDSQDLHDFIQENCTTINQRYWPTVWCPHAHLITAVSFYTRSFIPELKYYREQIPTPDGGLISLDWYDPEGTLEAQLSNNPKSSTPVAVFIPGIAGYSQVEYLRTLVPIAHKIGYRAVALNYRGLDGNPILTPRLYCGATHDDQKTALQYIRREKCLSNTRIVATGISMGGTVLAGYLATHGTDSLIDAACLISACFDFTAGADNLATGLLNPLMNSFITRSLIDVVMSHRQWFEDKPHVYDLEAIQKCRNLRNFDNAFTRHMFGFDSADDYYRKSTHKDRLQDIKVPTFCINAADDMIVPEKDLPLEGVKKSSHVAMLVTARGGHIGFIDGLLLPNYRNSYLERVFSQYMAALFDRQPVISGK